MYPYGLIGNCQAAALVSDAGSIDWFCLPRPDSEPVFGRLLDKNGGSFSVHLENLDYSRQSYIKNTNILETVLTDKTGATVKVTDFFPRFQQYGRMYRPNALFRILEPLSGTPIVRVSCSPVLGWNKTPAKALRGNSHLNFDIRENKLRLTTNMPLTSLIEQEALPVQKKIYLALTCDSAIEEDLGELSERFLRQTENYWRTWVQHCNVPTLFQEQVIRSALALKLHCYEDTGAILASLTTSLPEEKGGARNWDYRFCWLRDAYFTLSAFNQLGHFEEMEGFLQFLTQLALKRNPEEKRLQPVYALDHKSPLPEMNLGNWDGFADSKPVRYNNQAAEHIQNDVYGEMILTLAPIFFDERFYHLRTEENRALLCSLARLAADSISKPDAGLWELRSGWQEHTFTNLMSWAGLDRISRIQRAGLIGDTGFDVDAACNAARAAVNNALVDGSVRNGPKDPSFDSSLLLLPILRFPDRDAACETVHEIMKKLRYAATGASEAFLYRYSRPDDFGKPRSAFLICSYWLVQALTRTGEEEKAREIMYSLSAAANHLGLLSEHFLPNERMQGGNFPQAYSHVGEILGAFAVSPSWNEVL